MWWRPLRDLLRNEPVAPDRILHVSHWFSDHNNPRHEELLPRLERLDAYFLRIPARQPLRSAAFRAMRAARPRAEALLVRRGARRYGNFFATDPTQAPLFPGPVAVDVDDPQYFDHEVAALKSPNVAFYVVTEERAARRYQELGVGHPFEVMPQGVDVHVDAERVRRVRTTRRRDGDFVVGYVAAWLLSGADRGGENPLYNVDHLFELWDEIARRLPHARLWLIGGASGTIAARAAARDDVVVLGRLPRPGMLAHLASLDVGLYPRTKDQGIQSVKVAEFLGLGIPVVAYDYAVTDVVRRVGGGILVSTPREFADAVERLAHDGALRAELAAAGRAYGEAIDWRVLARRYNELLDHYLPPR